MASEPTRFAPASPHPLRQALGGKIAYRVAAGNDDSDLRLFVVSFTAFFVCFYTFFL